MLDVAVTGVVSGTCNCETVAFEVAVPLKDIYVCHCSLCRRWTGNNGVAVLVVASEHFRWVRGANAGKAWEKPGHDWKSYFCGNCGSALPGENDESTVFIPAGLVDHGGEGLSVAHHIWVDSRAPWDVIGDGGQQHPRAFGSAPPEE